MGAAVEILLNMIVPLTGADADFDSLLHEAGGDDDGIDEACLRCRHDYRYLGAKDTGCVIEL